jgi:hypothetical protein
MIMALNQADTMDYERLALQEKWFSVLVGKAILVSVEPTNTLCMI